MLNKTSINKEVVKKVLGACRLALTATSGLAYINNKKGEYFLRVKRIKKHDGSIGFQVLDKSNKNIAEMITNTLILDRKSVGMFGAGIPINLNVFILKRLAYPYQIA